MENIEIKQYEKRNKPMAGKQYVSSILKLIDKTSENQYNNILEAAEMIYMSLKNGGVLHVFGCGHSHILCEECFYRAGGLVPVNPIFESSTMLHEGAVKSSFIEQLSGYAPLILNNYEVKKGEVIIIFSTSGINPMPIEMAKSAKKKGLKVIAFSSSNYDNSMSRDKSGKRMSDFADLTIDTNVPHGDAMITFENTGISAVPGSTVIGAALLNMLIAEIFSCFDRDGITPPAYVSGNINGGFEQNQKYIEKYRKRIKSL